MLTGANVKQILDASVRDISSRVGKLEVIDSYEASTVKMESPYTIYVTTSGDFQEMFSFSADIAVLETIAQNMMRGARVSEDELQVCALEFFNILCGQAISTINKRCNTRTRFSVPSMEKGTLLKKDEQHVRNRQVFSYSCGKAQFEILSIHNTK